MYPSVKETPASRSTPLSPEIVPDMVIFAAGSDDDFATQFRVRRRDDAGKRNVAAGNNRHVAVKTFYFAGRTQLLQVAQTRGATHGLQPDVV